MTTPRALQVGDTIAFLALASGVAVPAAHRLQQGKKYFESLGYIVKLYPSCFENGRYSSCEPEMRAMELMDAFQDPSIKAIISTIGGLTSHELLEHLDFSVLAKHPTIFCGFSDMTTLHLALYAQAGLVTFYGPSVLCQFGEFPGPLQYTTDAFFSAVSQTTMLGSVKPSTEWTDDKSANWFTKDDMCMTRSMKDNSFGYEWLRSGQASGPLLGGCLPVLMNVFGSKYMPSLSGCILLLETPESDHAFYKGMQIDLVNVSLGVLRMNGTLGSVNGIIVGRGFAYTEEEILELKRLFMHHTRGYDIPIVYGVDCGHTDPVATWPLGVSVTLDSARNVVSINAPAVH